MAPELSYLSYSSINLYLTCSEAWRRRYVLGEKEPPTGALLLGSTVHDTLEGWIAARAQGESQAGTLADAFSRNWALRVEREPNCEWGADTPEQICEEGLRLVSDSSVQALVNRLTPLRDDSGPWIEREVFLSVPGVPVPVKGYIDLVTSDGVPGDFKTSRMAWSADKAQEQLQPLFYLAALNQLGRTVPGLRFRHWVIVKGKTVRVQELEHQHTWDEILWLFGLIQGVWRAISAEAFVPNPNAWFCAPGRCRAWSTCRGRRFP